MKKTAFIVSVKIHATVLNMSRQCTTTEIHTLPFAITWIEHGNVSSIKTLSENYIALYNDNIIKTLFVFYNGKFISNTILNANSLEKLIK